MDHIAFIGSAKSVNMLNLHGDHGRVCEMTKMGDCDFNALHCFCVSHVFFLLHLLRWMWSCICMGIADVLFLPATVLKVVCH